MSDEITVVSGLPRSGTSMMMRMLEAGGMEAVTDNIRQADEDNPRGYYEFERVKKIKEDKAWLPTMQGKVVKMVSMLLTDLPADYRYRVVFMKRPIEEVLASQRKMLQRRGGAEKAVHDDRMGDLFRRHLAQIEDWLVRQPNIRVLFVDYRAVLEKPREQAERLAAFFDGALSAETMATAVDASLYRNRAPATPR
jgi:hypothetical protein